MKKKLNQSLSLLLCVAFLFCLSACKKDEAKKETKKTESVSSSAEVTGIWKDAQYTEDTTLGEGKTTIVLEVKAEDKTVKFTVNTDSETVGEALIKNKLIEGEDGEYGLYVKKVNGMTADFDVDKTYWAFYIDNEYASTGVDSTKIEKGKVYRLERTK